MTLRRTIYNSIGLAIAGFNVVMLILTLVHTLWVNPLQNRHPVIFLMTILIHLVWIIFVGGGSFGNLVKNRMQPNATVVMSVIYCMSVVGIPVGIWGIFELHSGESRQRTSRTNEANATKGKSPFSAGFVRRAATISWTTAIFGSVLGVTCVVIHFKPLTYVAAPMYLLAIMSSLVLGIVALLGVRQYGKKGISTPALVGVCVSGFSVLLISAATIIELTLREVKVQHRHAAIDQSDSFDQTNSVSKQP